MSVQQFKIAKGKDQIFLYPFPVDKPTKYLIQCENLKIAEFMQQAFALGYLRNPREQETMYLDQGLHTDGQTPIFAIQWDKFHLHYLKHRELDPDKANIVEGVLSKKIISFLMGNLEVSKLKKTIQNQQNCIECQKLGINDSSLQEFLQKL